MATRPQNIGIKAIEIYFPQQVSVVDSVAREDRSNMRNSASNSLNSKSSMASLPESTQSVSARPK